MTNWDQGTPVERAELPERINTYLAAHLAREIDTAVAAFAPDATATDEGRTHHGREEIRAWLATAGTEYTYTIEAVGARTIDRDHHVVVHHLEGDFPGGVADLQFKFALRDGAIGALVIEP